MWHTATGTLRCPRLAPRARVRTGAGSATQRKLRTLTANIQDTRPSSPYTSSGMTLRKSKSLWKTGWFGSRSLYIRQNSASWSGPASVNMRLLPTAQMHCTSVATPTQHATMTPAACGCCLAHALHFGCGPNPTRNNDTFCFAQTLGRGPNRYEIQVEGLMCQCTASWCSPALFLFGIMILSMPTSAEQVKLELGAPCFCS